MNLGRVFVAYLAIGLALSADICVSHTYNTPGALCNYHYEKLGCDGQIATFPCTFEGFGGQVNVTEAVAGPTASIWANGGTLDVVGSQYFQGEKVVSFSFTFL